MELFVVALFWRFDLPFAPPNLLILLNRSGFESRYLRQVIECKRLIRISQLAYFLLSVPRIRFWYQRDAPSIIRKRVQFARDGVSALADGSYL